MRPKLHSLVPPLAISNRPTRGPLCMHPLTAHLQNPRTSQFGCSSISRVFWLLWNLLPTAVFPSLEIFTRLMSACHGAILGPTALVVKLLLEKKYWNFTQSKQIFSFNIFLVALKSADKTNLIRILVEIVRKLLRGIQNCNQKSNSRTEHSLKPHTE